MWKVYFKTLVLLAIFVHLVSSITVEQSKGKKHKNSSKRTTLRCGANEQVASSGTDCLNCDNYNQTANCTTEYQTKCYCQKGLVRGPYNNCIPPSNCTKTCKANELYVTKPPCEFRCGGPSYLRQECHCQLSSGCICKEGYVRCHWTNNCIPKAECYPDCKANESPFGRSCLPVCENNQTKPGPCPIGVKLECKRICNCNEGYIRNTINGQCIPERQCKGNSTG